MLHGDASVGKWKQLTDFRAFKSVKWRDESNYCHFTLGLFYLALWLIDKTRAVISSPRETPIKPKPIVTCSHTFTRAWHSLHTDAYPSARELL